MERKKEEACQRTVEFFNRKYGLDLSPEEAARINERITCYFRLLYRWQKAQNEASGGQSGIEEDHADAV